MYETWFNFSKRPFQAPPQAVSYFPNDVFESACEGLWRCIQRNAGPGVVIGEHGTGKSLLSLLMANQFQSSWSVVQISAPSVRSRKELIQTILFELGLPYVASDEGELRLSLLDHLTSARLNHDGTLLIIDDSHDLSIELLEQVASLSGLVREGRWCIDLVMLGTTALEEKLVHPALTSLNQRVAARYYLRPWPSHVTVDYVRHQLSQAGGDVHAVFEDTALQQIHELTRGVPRLVNQLCDHSLILAAAGGVRQINSAMVREAWADLQQLPKENSAHVISSPLTEDDPIVEFGSLDDEPGLVELPPPLADADRSRQSAAPDQIDAEAAKSVDEAPEDDDFPYASPAADGASPMDTWQRVFEQPRRVLNRPDDASGSDVFTEDATHRILDEIEQQLLEANGDLQDFVAKEPARPATTGHRAANPFYETFSEEEIVISRNCLPEVDWMNRQPTVKTTRGTELLDALRLLEFEDSCADSYLDNYARDRGVEHDAEEVEGPPHYRRDLEVSTAVTETDEPNLDLQIAYATGDLEPSRDGVKARHAMGPPPTAFVLAESQVCLASSYVANSGSAEIAEISGEGVSNVIVANPDNLAFGYEDPERIPESQNRVPAIEAQRPAVAQAEPESIKAQSASPNCQRPTVGQPRRERKFSRLFSNLKRP